MYTCPVHRTVDTQGRVFGGGAPITDGLRGPTSHREFLMPVTVKFLLPVKITPLCTRVLIFQNEWMPRIFSGFYFSVDYSRV